MSFFIHIAGTQTPVGMGLKGMGSWEHAENLKVGLLDLLRLRVFI